MADTRKRNINWRIDTNLDGTTPARDAALAVLMDIREELQSLNGLFRCPNLLTIPQKIDAIRKNTARPKRKRKKL